MTGNELSYITQAHAEGHLSGDGRFSRQCSEWLQLNTGTSRALLTHSCTAALEMAALLLDIQPGDEVILPSYTFVSTANAFALRGARLVFVDIRSDTLNIDETLIESAITKHTRAIIPVHYAGVACEMDSILNLARHYQVAVVEDAAQAIMASYQGRSLGSLGHLGTFSFHETKNVISGEGGALLVNEPSLVESAEIIREKGTDRSRFFRGEVDKYTWQRLGSSFLPGEVIAAFLWAQLEQAKEVTKQRLALWERYHTALQSLEEAELLRRPIIPSGCEHNAHMYYIVLPEAAQRPQLLAALKHRGILAIFHYIPLHNSPAGLSFGRCHGDLNKTEDLAARIVRLPMWTAMTEAEQDMVIEHLFDLL